MAWLKIGLAQNYGSNQKTDNAFTLSTFEDHQLCFYEKKTHSRRKTVLKWDLLFFTSEIYHQF